MLNDDVKVWGLSNSKRWNCHFLRQERLQEGQVMGKPEALFLDMLSLRCLVNIQVEMSTRSLNEFASLKMNEEALKV